MKNIFFVLSVLLVASIFSGCGLRAPDVSLNKIPSIIRTEKDLGVTELCPEEDFTECGTLTANLRLNEGDDRWIYWKAGASTLSYNVDPRFVASLDWDMRLTKRFPLIGTNGGKTAQDIGHPEGKSAFAVWSDDPNAGRPVNAADVQGLSFIDDVYQGLEFGGIQLGSEYQNPLLNNIGPGMLKSYNMRDHSVELSQRIFILRNNSGTDYFAIRFRYYSRVDAVLVFDWRKL